MLTYETFANMSTNEWILRVWIVFYTQGSKLKFNYVHLRLADVIGERDGTDRSFDI